MMACFALAPGSLRLLMLMVTIVTLAAVVDSAAPKPIKLYASCAPLMLPKKCSFVVSLLSKGLADTQEVVAGPQLAAAKLKSDPCISKCAEVVSKSAQHVHDVATSTLAPDETQDGVTAVQELTDYLISTCRNEYGYINPCHCNCTEPCSADEAAAVKKLGVVSRALPEATEHLDTLFDGLGSKNREQVAAAMEMSIDSGLFHVTCGLMKEPQKCVDGLAALAKASKEAGDLLWGRRHKSKKLKLRPGLQSAISQCHTTVETYCRLEIESAMREPKNPADVRSGIIQHLTKGCKWSCPTPPETPCSADELAAVNKMKAVYDSWVATENFLAELQPLPEFSGIAKEMPKEDL